MEKSEKKSFEMLITNGYDLLTENIENINKKSKITSFINTNSNNDLTYTIKLIDKNTTIMSGNCLYIGSYDSTTQIFQWGWNDFTNKKYKDSLKIKDYGKMLKKTLLENKYKDSNIVEKTIFCTTKPLFIASKDLMNWIVKLYVYILEGIYPISLRDNNITYFFLAKDIFQY
jgi:hypothetical protein